MGREEATGDKLDVAEGGSRFWMVKPEHCSSIASMPRLPWFVRFVPFVPFENVMTTLANV